MTTTAEGGLKTYHPHPNVDNSKHSETTMGAYRGEKPRPEMTGTNPRQCRTVYYLRWAEKGAKLNKKTV